MRYVLEILTYRGWVPDFDDDYRLYVMGRAKARKVLRECRANSKRYGQSHEYRLRIVNAPAPRNRKARQERKKRWLTDYRTDRAYGGPEEGGWWFDTGIPVDGTCVTFYSEANARAEQDRRNDLNDAFNKSRGSRGDISSVVCDYALRTFCEDEPPRPYPEQTPRYC